MKAQALLARAHLGPGAIDGREGRNFQNALQLFRKTHGIAATGPIDPESWKQLGGEDTVGVMTEYTLTKDDAAYPYVGEIPADYAKQAEMKALDFRTPAERFGEMFHMDPRLVVELNPGAKLDAEGAVIHVVAPPQPLGKLPTDHIEADKSRSMLIAYAQDKSIVAAYPATIGSEETPSPTGTYKVTGVAKNPVYYYDPEKNFQQGANDKRLKLPPGPNNPVGSMWIDLSKPTFGIHGTPEPTKIGYAASHGCVRLTNWDAQELAGLVKPGTTVAFVE